MLFINRFYFYYVHTYNNILRNLLYLQFFNLVFIDNLPNTMELLNTNTILLCENTTPNKNIIVTTNNILS